MKIIIILSIVLIVFSVFYIRIKNNKNNNKKINLKNTKTSSERLGISKESISKIDTKNATDIEVKSYGPKLDPLIEEGNSSLEIMKSLLSSITDDCIKIKIQTIIDLTNKIIEHAINDEDDVPQIKKFFKYYLPTTVKLLTTYQNLESQCIEGTNISESKQRINEMLDVAIEAYKNRLDSLFENQALDIETDIDVMNQLLNKEGLLNKDELQLKEGTINV